MSWRLGDPDPDQQGELRSAGSVEVASSSCGTNMSLTGISYLAEAHRRPWQIIAIRVYESRARPLISLIKSKMIIHRTKTSARATSERGKGSDVQVYVKKRTPSLFTGTPNTHTRESGCRASLLYCVRSGLSEAASRRGLVLVEDQQSSVIVEQSERIAATNSRKLYEQSCQTTALPSNRVHCNICSLSMYHLQLCKHTLLPSLFSHTHPPLEPIAQIPLHATIQPDGQLVFGRMILVIALVHDYFAIRQFDLSELMSARERSCLAANTPHDRT